MFPAARASTCCPISRHGTEYRALPTLRWQSGPIGPVDQVASTKSLGGNGFSAAASTASNTDTGLAPSNDAVGPDVRDLPAPASAPRPASAASEVNSRPRQNESRTYGIARSTRGLSFGLNARAGSASTP